MKTAAEIANHPKARLHGELVTLLRRKGSIKGAEQEWVCLRLNHRRWKKIEAYGFGVPKRQFQLNKVAFPDCNFVEVDAALRAGNKLHQLHELACGRASIGMDSAGQYRWGNRGLKIIKHATATIYRG